VSQIYKTCYFLNFVTFSVNVRGEPGPIMAVFNELGEVLDTIIMITHEQPLHRCIGPLMGPDLVNKIGLPNRCDYLEGYCIDPEAGTLEKLSPKRVYLAE